MITSQDLTLRIDSAKFTDRVSCNNTFLDTQIVGVATLASEPSKTFNFDIKLSIPTENNDPIQDEATMCLEIVSDVLCNILNI